MASKDKYADYKKILYGDSGSSTPTKTANNYKVRLEAAGVDPNKALDKRNPLEKFLNLEQDQNFIFDIFELINRPQQALFNAWKTSQEGGDALDAAWKGFSGQNDVQFKDILKNYGMEDRQGKIDAADILGFAGDIFLDPMDLIPVAGFSKFGDALQAGESFGKAAKNLKSGTDVVFNLAGKGVKGAAKLADNSIEKALAKADDLAGIAYSSPTAKMATDLGKYAKNGVDDVTNVVGKLENYKQIKNDFSRMFKLTPKEVNAVLTKRGGDIAQDDARAIMAELIKQYDGDMTAYAKAHNIDPDLFKEDMGLVVGALRDRTISGDKLLRVFKEGNLENNETYIEALNNMVETNIPDNVIKDYGLDFSIKVDENTGKLVPGKDWFNDTYRIKTASEDQLYKWQLQYEQALSDGNTKLADKLLKNIKDNTLEIPLMYNDDQIKRITSMLDKYRDDKSFRNLMDNIAGTGWKHTAGSAIESDLGNLIEQSKAVGNTSIIKPSLVDRLNSIIDENMGSGLATKYDMVDNAGYLPLTTTEAGSSIAKQYNTNIGKKTRIGNTRLLAERTTLGSGAEVNNQISDIMKSWDDEVLKSSPELKAFRDSNAKFIEENYTKALTNRYLKQEGITNVVKNADMANKILVKETFGDTDEILKLKSEIKNARFSNDLTKVNDLTAQLSKIQADNGIKFLDATDSLVPKGYTKYSKTDMIGKLKTYETMMKQVGIDSGIGSLIKTLEGFDGSFAMDETIANMFEYMSKRDNYTGLAGLYNKYMNVFKKWKTASPTFLLNNLLGNSSNLMLGGVSLKDQAKYGSTVADIISNGQTYHTMQLAGKELTEHQQKIADLWQEYRKLGFDRSALALQELPEEFQDLFRGEKKLKNAKDVITDGLPYLNNLANVNMDNAARLTIMLKIKDDPGFIKRLGVSNTREAISKIMFDPEMLTAFEKNKLKKVIPFYTYTKNNLIYHATNIGQNGKKYNQLMKSMKGLRNLATDGNEQDMSDFIKNNLYIPIPGIDKDGNYKVLRASLPFGQVIDVADDPLNALVGLVTPAVKGPIELLTNKSAFNGSEIEKFPGELSKNIPFMTKKTEKIIGDLTGLDVPIKNASRIYQGIADAVKRNQNIAQSVGRGLRNTVVMDNNVNNDKLYRTYEEIEDLQNLMKQYQQRGTSFATMTELKKANKNKTLEGIDAIFNKYGITSNKKSDDKYSDLRALLQK